MPLKVVIVGAGIAGLAAAIALHKSGHDVLQSRFHNEVGAAISLAPNATRVLGSLGLDLEGLQAVHCDGAWVWNAMGERLLRTALTKDVQAALQMSDSWLLTHRVDLHDALRAEATKDVDGKRIGIILASRVASVDSELGLVRLEDGTSTRSRSVSAIGLDGVKAFLAPDCRLVMYPCRQGHLLNCAAIHPADSETTAKYSFWLDSGSVDDLVSTFQDFSPEIQQPCRLAEDLKLWSLVCRRPPRTFVKGKLALIGDAAHPILPHQGQGGAQAFEDVAALSTLLPSAAIPEQISERLSFDRDVLTSQVPNERWGEILETLRTYVPDAEVPEDMRAYTWSSYPARKAEKLLAAL
ncbi:hypothetical protein BDW74DRAFT_190137 [Aspergillus multicolor]|uniref:uncharacterized protein n=1 Tax=Aspergillus multicolor TaxID=41759 RepID=UPI003CCDDE58